MGCIKSKSKPQKPVAVAIQTLETRERALKYSGRLLPVEAGHVITIVGKSLEKADYFNIFFGSDDGLIEGIGDIQMHINFDFKTNKISRNAYTVADGWGDAETEENVVEGNVANPLKPGEAFKVEIFVDDDRFHVTIDSKPFCTFSHRQPIKNIHRINVYGAIEKIHTISHITKKAISKALANSESLINIIPPTKLGSVLSFSGMPQGSENGVFEINLADDITKRVMFRLTANLGSKKVMGCSQNEKKEWQPEVTHTPEEFPFAVNRMFKLAIGVTSKEFVISTDGQFSMRYPHDGDISENPLKIEILSRDGLSMDVFGINNYTRGEKVKSVAASFVYVADGSKKVEFRKGWNPEKSLERIYGNQTATLKAN